METSGTSVIRDVVLSTPGATLAFERFHVDYCCGGSLSLAEACERAGAPLEGVLAALVEEAARPGAEIAGGEMLSVPLELLVGRLLDVHHLRSREAAAALVPRAKQAAAGDPRLARIAELVDELFGALLPHLDFEERHVFPYVVALERAGRDNTRPPVALFESIAEPMREMEREHEACDRAMHEIHTIAASLRDGVGDGDPTGALLDALDEHERELVRHMHLEGNVLLPRAERLEQKLRAAAGTGRRHR